MSEAAEKAALTSTDKGDDDVTVGVFGGGWSGVLETLRRLESAAIGSLAVAYFKVSYSCAHCEDMIVHIEQMDPILYSYVVVCVAHWRFHFFLITAHVLY